jgi:hypothetical protein
MKSTDKKKRLMHSREILALVTGYSETTVSIAMMDDLPDNRKNSPSVKAISSAKARLDEKIEELKQEFKH